MLECAAHRAIAAWRTGDVATAWAIHQSAIDLADADAQTLGQLGIVSYLCRQGDSAVTLLQRASQTTDGTTLPARPYLALAHLNQVFSGTAQGTVEDILACLQQEMVPASGLVEADPSSLDVAWVRGGVWHVLARPDKATAALPSRRIVFFPGGTRQRNGKPCAAAGERSPGRPGWTNASRTMRAGFPSSGCSLRFKAWTPSTGTPSVGISRRSPCLLSRM